jgi:hypothetical protein
MALHKNLTGEVAIHQSAYVQSSDPGAVGALKAWIDTTTTPALHKVRNSANTAWLVVGSSGIAADISYAGSAGLVATDVEAALDELDTEKAAAADLTAHTGDTTDAHDASAISVTDTGGYFTDSDVESVLQEIGSGAVGGGGSGYRTLVTLGSDVATTSETFVDLTGLSFSVTNGVTYRYYALILFTADATTTGSRWSINGPGASQPYLVHRAQWGSASQSSTVMNNNLSNDGSASTASKASTGGNIATIEGFYKATSSGTFTIRFSIETGSGGTITAKAGSTLEYW